MDLAVVIGLIIAFGAILGGNVLEGGHLSSLVVPSAFLIVVGGTIGSTMVSFSMRDLLRLPSILLHILRQPDLDLRQLIERIVEAAQVARREGLLALEEAVANMDDPFLVRGLQMVVDGSDSETVRSIMEMEIDLSERENETGIKILETAGGYAPTMGIIGTVLGLVHVLGNLNNAEDLGPAIAVAFMATFYGIASANLIWLPLAAKLKVRSEEETLVRELILEGIISIQRGDNPGMVREKLSIFLKGDGHVEEGGTVSNVRAREQNV